MEKCSVSPTYDGSNTPTTVNAGISLIVTSTRDVDVDEIGSGSVDVGSGLRR
jgi:hypothetical protein